MKRTLYEIMLLPNDELILTATQDEYRFCIVTRAQEMPKVLSEYSLAEVISVRSLSDWDESCTARVQWLCSLMPGYAMRHVETACGIHHAELQKS